jgi:FlaA1/EpsC-like NDP-sugar epimerase
LIAVLAAHLTAGLIEKSQIGNLSPLGYQFSTLLLGLLYVLTLYFQDLYAVAQQRSSSQIAASILSASVKMSVLLALVALAAPSFSFGRRFYAAFIAISAPTIVGWRLAANAFVRRITQSVMVLGTGEPARMLADELQRREHLGYNFLGYAICGDPAESASNLRVDENKPVRIAPSLTELVNGFHIDSLVVTNHDGTQPFPVRELMDWRVSGAEVVDFETYYERLTGKLPRTVRA